VLLAANRDEDPRRPSDPPAVLSTLPPIAGGRDRIGGGTWLAVRERRAVVALLNRRDREPESVPGARRSRGLLTLEAAAAGGDSLSAAVRESALASVRAFPYAPFTLVFASRAECWALVLDGDGLREVAIEPGWHVLTHRELDDPDEPRTRYLMSELSGYRPVDSVAAEQRLAGLLRHHGDPAAPAVCLHQGRMVTVSSTLVGLEAQRAWYRHAEGRPCEVDHADHSALLRDMPSPAA
jgi:hypothetical protein